MFYCRYCKDNTMITSGLAYCKSFYFDLPDCLLDKCYYVQRSAARLITLTGKYEHITIAFIALASNQIEMQIQKRLLVYNAYLVDLIDRRADLGSCRYNDNFLNVPNVNRVTSGGMNCIQRPMNSGITYLLLYIRAKLLIFLNLD